MPDTVPVERVMGCFLGQVTSGPAALTSLTSLTSLGSESRQHMAVASIRSAIRLNPAHAGSCSPRVLTWNQVSLQSPWEPVPRARLHFCVPKGQVGPFQTASPPLAPLSLARSACRGPWWPEGAAGLFTALGPNLGPLRRSVPCPVAPLVSRPVPWTCHGDPHKSR